MQMPMNMGPSPESEAGRLREDLERQGHSYHTLDSPEVSDAEYDAGMRRLRQIEQEHPELQAGDSPTRKVGGALLDGFQPAMHPYPMLSLGNVYDRNELNAWHQRIPGSSGAGPELIAEPKIDGVALRLHYLHGQLVEAATRGNGREGEDVTVQAMTINAIPLSLKGKNIPTHVHVRGEVYMPRSGLAAFNQERAALGGQQLANARNGAAGALRQLDPAETARRPLAFFAYGWDNPDPEALQTAQGSYLDWMQAAGLPVNPDSARCTSLEEVDNHYRQLMDRRSALDYDIDGMVVKVLDLRTRDEMGSTSHEPRWAVAWKFPPEQATTRLFDIKTSVGRFGRLTPVAVLEPVQVGGVTVSSASLHNEDDVRRKNIRAGARVIVQRAGDVIPQVVGPASDEETATHVQFSMPDFCPECHSPVVTRPGEVGHWCIREDCPGRLPEALESFVGRDAMDIEGIGPVWCRQLAEDRMVGVTADLYRLDRARLMQLDRMGPRTAEKLLQNVENSKNRPLANVLYALGINMMGRKVCGLLAGICSNVLEVQQLSRQALENIDGIGPAIAASVWEGLHSERTRANIHQMDQAGVAAIRDQGRNHQQFQEEEVAMTRNEEFQGKTFVVTGKITGMTRVQAEQAIQKQGGLTASSVNGKTDVLVVGESPGSKLNKAYQLGVTVVDEDQFFAMLKG